jgi:hypothetical protein
VPDSEDQRPRSRFLFSEDRQCVSNALIIRLGVEVPPTALVVLVDPHEALAGKRREVPRDSTVGVVIIDAFERCSKFKVSCLAGLMVRIEYDLEVSIIVAAEARRNVAEPLTLSLSAGDTSFDPLDRSAAFLFGDNCTDIGNELFGPVGSNFVDPAVGDRDGRTGLLASPEELLIDATQASEPRDLPDDIVVLAGFDRRDEVGKLLTTRVCPGLREVNVAIDLCRIGVVLVEPSVDRLALVGGLLGVG